MAQSCAARGNILALFILTCSDCGVHP